MTSKLFTSYHDPIPLSHEQYEVVVYTLYIHYYVHCTRHTGCNNPPESTQYYLLLQLAASKTQGGDDGVFYYNHNHKYMYAYIYLCSQQGVLLTLEESKYVSTEKMGLLCRVDSCCWVMECAYMCRRTFYYYAIATSLIMMYSN